MFLFYRRNYNIAYECITLILFLLGVLILLALCSRKGADFEIFYDKDLSKIEERILDSTSGPSECANDRLSQFGQIDRRIKISGSTSNRPVVQNTFDIVTKKIYEELESSYHEKFGIIESSTKYFPMKCNSPHSCKFIYYIKTGYIYLKPPLVERREHIPFLVRIKYDLECTPSPS